MDAALRLEEFANPASEPANVYPKQSLFQGNDPP